MYCVLVYECTSCVIIIILCRTDMSHEEAVNIQFNLVAHWNAPTFLRTRREVHLTARDDAAGRRILYYIAATTTRQWTESATWPRWIAYWFFGGFLKYNWCFGRFSQPLVVVVVVGPSWWIAGAHTVRVLYYVYTTYTYTYTASETFRNGQFVGPEIIYFRLFDWYTSDGN